MQCLRWAGAHEIGGEAKCWSPENNPISYTHVIQTIEDLSPAGSTNLAMALREGLEELGVSIPVYNPDVTFMNVAM